MTSDAQIPRAKQRRIARACENCRKRKAKCDGREPVCSICAQHGETCTYREKARIRRKQQSEPSATSSLIRTPLAQDAQGVPPNIQVLANPAKLTTPNAAQIVEPHVPTASTRNLTQDEAQVSDIHRSISAARSLSHLYYGPSSNFAFLQHVHQTFADPARNRAANDHDATSSLDIFKQKEIFFGLSDSNNVGPETICGQVLFLPQTLAEQFLNDFGASLFHLMSWVNLGGLREALVKSYQSSTSFTENKDDRASLLCVLAIGATVTYHDHWAKDLYKAAAEEVARLNEVVNLKSVQISLLVAHYQLIYGQPNAAYLQLGQACRKAFAAGLHKDVEYAVTPCRGSSPEERRSTLWSLVFFERWVSFWLGRPSCTIAITISAPMPQSAPVIRCLAELSSIVKEAAREIYDDQKKTRTKLWESAQQIRMKLHDFQRRSELILGFPLDGSISGPPVNTAQVFMMNFFCHVWMITFRPFLIMFYSWKKGSGPDRCGSSDSAGLPIDLWWLGEACQIATDYAHRLIDVFSRATQLSDLVKGLSFSVSFLESACCLLFYDAMRTPEPTDAHIASLRKAHDCFASMLKKGPVTATLQTTQQLLKELEKFRAVGVQVNEDDTTRRSMPQANNMHTDDISRAMSSAIMSFPRMTDDNNVTYNNYGLDEFFFVPDLDNYFNSSLDAII